MASVSVSDQPVIDLYLLPGEVPETRDLEDARQWVSIYRELVTFSERTLSRLRSAGGDADEPVMETHLRRLQSRLDFWEGRLWELAGLDLDVRRRVLNYAGQRVTLTRREAELLAFLARRPGQFYSATQLVSLAWPPPECRPGWSANRAAATGWCSRHERTAAAEPQDRPASADPSRADR